MKEHRSGESCLFTVQMVDIERGRRFEVENLFIGTHFQIVRPVPSDHVVVVVKAPYHFAGLFTVSILRTSVEKCVFLQTHNQGLCQLFLTVSLDLLA